MRIGLEDYFKNLLATTNCYEKAGMVCVPREMFQDTKVKGLPDSDSIDPSKLPRNYWRAMSLTERGMKIMGMTTRTEYKVTNGVFSKRQVRLCARGDQEKELQFKKRDIY